MANNVVYLIKSDATQAKAEQAALTKSVKDTEAAQQKVNKEVAQFERDLRRALLSTRTPLDRLKQQQDILNRGFQEGRLTTDEYRKAINRVGEQIRELETDTNEVEDAIQSAFNPARMLGYQGAINAIQAGIRGVIDLLGQQDQLQKAVLEDQRAAIQELGLLGQQTPGDPRGFQVNQQVATAIQRAAGISAAQSADFLRQALSARLSETDISLLTAATRARAIREPGEVVADIQSIRAVLGPAAASFEDTADVIADVNKVAQADFNQLARAVSRSVGLGAQVGLDLNQVAAATAVLSRTGGAEFAATSLENIFQQALRFQITGEQTLRIVEELNRLNQESLAESGKLLFVDRQAVVGMLNVTAAAEEITKTFESLRGAAERNTFRSIIESNLTDDRVRTLTDLAASEQELAVSRAQLGDIEARQQITRNRTLQLIESGRVSEILNRFPAFPLPGLVGLGVPDVVEQSFQRGVLSTLDYLNLIPAARDTTVAPASEGPGAFVGDVLRDIQANTKETADNTRGRQPQASPVEAPQ